MNYSMVMEQAFFAGITSFNRDFEGCPYMPSQVHEVAWFYKGRRYAYLNKIKKENSLLTFRSL